MVLCMVKSEPMWDRGTLNLAYCPLTTNIEALLPSDAAPAPKPPLNNTSSKRAAGPAASAGAGERRSKRVRVSARQAPVLSPSGQQQVRYLPRSALQHGTCIVDQYLLWHTAW
jgi:hypothetical protein